MGWHATLGIGLRSATAVRWEAGLSGSGAMVLCGSLPVRHSTGHAPFGPAAGVLLGNLVRFMG